MTNDIRYERTKVKAEILSKFRSTLEQMESNKSKKTLLSETNNHNNFLKEKTNNIINENVKHSIKQQFFLENIEKTLSTQKTSYFKPKLLLDNEKLENTTKKIKSIIELNTFQNEKEKRKISIKKDLTETELESQKEYYRWEMKTKVLLATKNNGQKIKKHVFNFLSKVNEECNLKKINRLDAWGKILLGEYKKLALFGEIGAATLASSLCKQNEKNDYYITWLGSGNIKIDDNSIIRKIMKKQRIKQRYCVNIEWLPLSLPSFTPDFLFLILPYQKNFKTHLMLTIQSCASVLDCYGTLFLTFEKKYFHMFNIEQLSLFLFHLKLQTIIEFNQDLGKLTNSQFFSSDAETYIFSPVLIKEIPNINLELIHLDVLKDENIITTSDLLDLSLIELDHLCNKNKKCIKNGEHMFYSLFRAARSYFDQTR